MYAKCIKCGSQKTHGSRVRSGERTAAMLFLRPVRCHECKERFWVHNPNAYLAAGAALTFIALVFATAWLIIEQNTVDRYFTPPSQPELEQPSDYRQTYGPTADTGLGPSNNARTDPRVKPASPPKQNSTEDHHFAVELYQESAKSGNSDAQYKLGLLYLTGNGALQDFDEAAKWLKLAAEQGYPLAQYELGLIYRMGQGVAVDQVESYVWLNLAAAAGIQQAVAAREEVRRGLSNKQLAQAQKVSRNWLASKSKSKRPHNHVDKAEPEETLPQRPSIPSSQNPSPAGKP